MSILKAIAADVAQRIEARKAVLPADRLVLRDPVPSRALSFRLQAAPYAVIAEIKFASPSEGVLSVSRDPVSVARTYLENGAQALSVLTEENAFQGSIDYLRAVRDAFPDACLLMKDFVVDEYQLYQARAAGADAVLLIVALLGREGVSRFLEAAERLGLEALVEVHDEEELRIAEDCGARLIGVNNRDLKTLKIDLGTSERLASQRRSQAVFVSESGIESGATLARLKLQGYQGFLIGSHFMRSGKPGESLAELLIQARGGTP